jgi:hypothetical protein
MTDPENRQLRAVFILLGGVVLCAVLAVLGLLRVFGVI